MGYIVSLVAGLADRRASGGPRLALGRSPAAFAGKPRRPPGLLSPSARCSAGAPAMCCSTICRFSSSIRWKFRRSWKGGMSFHGGLTGAALGAWLFARREKIPFFSVADLSCSVAPIGLFLVRIANFIKPELWGRPTDVPWAMIFPGAGPLPRHPSQLYEAGLEGLALGDRDGARGARRRLPPPRLDLGPVRRPLWRWRAFSANFSASRTRNSAFCSAARPWACCSPRRWSLLGGVAGRLFLAPRRPIAQADHLTAEGR